MTIQKIECLGVEELKRLDCLTEKYMNDSFSIQEVNEFKRLYEKWSQSVEDYLLVPLN